MVHSVLSYASFAFVINHQIYMYTLFKYYTRYIRSLICMHVIHKLYTVHIPGTLNISKYHSFIYFIRYTCIHRNTLYSKFT